MTVYQNDNKSILNCPALSKAYDIWVKTVDESKRYFERFKERSVYFKQQYEQEILEAHQELITAYKLHKK